MIFFRIRSILLLGTGCTTIPQPGCQILPERNYTGYVAVVADVFNQFSLDESLIVVQIRMDCFLVCNSPYKLADSNLGAEYWLLCPIGYGHQRSCFCE